MAENPPWETLRSLPQAGDEGNLFAAATRLEMLERAWARVRANAGCAGADGVTIERFAERAAQRLLGLMTRLRDGSYRPRPLRVFDIPKADGEQRRLAVPAVADRVAQTAVAMTLTPIVEPELDEASFAYRPGRSVQHAVRAIDQHRKAGFTQVVEGDIERYFDRVPQGPLLAKLEALLAGRPGAAALVDLIGLWLEAAAVDLDTPGVGIPQGSPLSPLLSNLYLDAVDEAFAAARRNLRFVRYGDDFVILTRRPEAAAAALEEMRRLLAGHGLGLNPEKTRIVDFDRGFKFLGHLFVRSMVLKSVEPEVAAEDPTARLMRWIAGEDATEAAAVLRQEEDSAKGLDRGLRILYVREPGRVLAVRNQAFTVEERGALGSRELIAVPAERIDRIELGPAVDVEAEAIRLALATDTLLHHVDGQGGTVGLTAPALSDHAGLHLAQASCVLDPERRRGLALLLVEARLRGQRAILHRLNRRRKERALIEPLRRLSTLLRKLPVAADVPALLGHEGAAAAVFWPAIARLVQPGWAVAGRPFRRVRRPCPDAFNVVLNYLAFLLTRDVDALVRRAGLHPGFGALHSARDGGDACVYDLVEVFRAPLAEGLAVYLFNNRVLGEAVFERQEDGSVRLARAGHAALIGGYQARLAGAVQSPRTKRRVTWRRLILEEAVAYAGHCRGDAGRGGEGYRPYRLDH